MPAAISTAVFLDLPPHQCDPRTAAAIVVPVPYDGTSSWMKGADRGPAAIIDASATVEFLDLPTGRTACDAGIATLPALDVAGLAPEEMTRIVHRAVDGVLAEGRLPIVLGGEHSVTIGAVDAARDHFPALSVLQVDAHADTRESYLGSTHNHACVMARARERCPIVQVGIRAVDASELAGLARNRVFFAHEIAASPDRAWMDRVVDLLTDDVYLTVDLDGFDPSILPATGTPEPGGLSWYEVNELVRRVAARRRIVGFDVVELLPMEGHHASAFTAAKLVYRILSEILAARARAGA
ncbi:MAG: agmatinase [Phycisphaeraceae bacterium]|nr:agmatinase [Phycisphaeraceae bacterium]